MADPVGINIAFDDAMLEAAPTWTRLDDTNNLVSGYSISRGRRDELQRTGTGVATVAINDTLGLFDPTNGASPYAGELDGKQISLALHDPVADTWSSLFRGVIDDPSEATMHASERVIFSSLQCVDALDYFAGWQLAPGNAGDTPPAGSEGDIFFDETPGTVDDRINDALDDCDWPAGLREIFTGNVRAQKVVYAAGSSILDVIQESADAEFPGIANFFVAKDGVVTFHGRLARFDPTNPDYEINFWKLGDGAAILADPDTVQIRGLSWTRSRKNVINSAFFAPKGIADADRAGQLVTDPTSIAAYGLHSAPFNGENLLIEESILTGNDANTECQLYGTYYVTTYADPQTRVNQIVVRSLRPDDPRAEPLWAFLCGVDISDVVTLTTTHTGGGGFSEDFFVEGLTYEVLPLQPDYQNVTLTLDVSPRSYYDFSWT